MKNVKQLQPLFLAGVLCCMLLTTFNTGCGIYSFKDISFPDSVKTVKINFIENHATYVNPQFSPTLTDRLKQKIVNQTKLTQTNLDERADWIIDGEVTEYYQSTVGVTATNGKSQTSINRLTVTVKITKREPRANKEPEVHTVSRQFDYGANQSLQTAEARLMDEMIRNITDEIFNSLFSSW
jgi:hypothetical protein